jgi:signal peptide peptidase SppA
MNYERIIGYVASTLWAIEPNKLNEILSILAFRASGQSFSAEEIAARIGSRGQSQPAQGGGAVAVVPIHGVIAHRMGAMDDSSGGTSTERIGAMLRQAHANPDVGSIVLDIDSPGGTVPGVQELAAEVFAMRGTKKIVAHVNSLAASAAYWIASQADEIVSTPSGSAGSIGVFSAHQDMSKALETAGIDVTLISAGKFKVEGSPFAPLSAEAKAFMQGRVDEAYKQFVHDVARGRGASAADVRSGYGEGRVLSSKDAIAAGLIDRVATMDATLSGLMGARAGLRAALADAAAAQGEAALLAALTAGEISPNDAREADMRRRLERF